MTVTVVTLLKRREVLAHLFLCAPKLVTPGRLELPAYGLGKRRSILLSYGVVWRQMPHFRPQFQTRWFVRRLSPPHPRRGHHHRIR